MGGGGDGRMAEEVGAGVLLRSAVCGLRSAVGSGWAAVISAGGPVGVGGGKDVEMLLAGPLICRTVAAEHGCRGSLP